MKGQTAQEGLVIFGLAVLLLLAVSILTLNWNTNTKSISDFLGERTECMKISNEVYSTHMLGDGANSSFVILKSASVENTSIFVGRASCHVCCNLTNGTTPIFNIDAGMISLQNRKGSVSVVSASGTTQESQGNSTIFFDGFESWGSSDCSHDSLWDSCSSGDGELRRDTDSQNGTYSIRFRDHDADTNLLINCIDLSGYSQSWIRFWWKKSGLDSGEYGKLDVNNTATEFTEVFDSGTGSSSYSQQHIDISSYISSNTCIRFHALANAPSDYFFLDDVEVVAS